MNPELFEAIVVRWLDGTATAEDIDALVAALEKPAYSRQLGQLMDGQLTASEQGRNDFPETYQRIHDYVMANKDRLTAIEGEVQETVAIEHPVRRIRTWRSVAAAAAVILVAAATWFFYPKDEKGPETAKTDIKAPVNNRATISIEGSRQIVLAEAPTGIIYEQNGIKIVKLADGRVAYEGISATVISNTSYNPKNSQPMEVDLTDGTRIWLNAGSSVTYPMVFTGNERRVILKGEAYFEVKHNEKQPFRVQAGQDLIEDIGTAFNVNAYEDEVGVTTTLVDGAVKIADKQLKPNQQYLNGKVSQADVPKALAWKNGQFNFGENVSIKEVMRQLARWYDVEVVYEGNVEGLNDFGGKISRDLSLSQAMTVLGTTRVNFRIEGKTIIITQ